MIWAQPWYDRSGEGMRYLPRSKAEQLRLPLGVDWWLLDDERLVLMYFTSAGGVAGKILTTDPGIVARHQQWRDLAVCNATARPGVSPASASKDCHE